MVRCGKCKAPPVGIEGHADLFAFRMSGSHLHFKCSTCDALWTRLYSGEGNFTWAPAGDDPLGIPVPGGKSAP